MNNKFLDKVCDQIVSETRIIDDKLYTPFFRPSFFPLYFFPVLVYSFISHCKDIYSLNKEETEYVWEKYKKGLTALMEDKEPAHQEKRMMIHNSENNNI